MQISLAMTGISSVGYHDPEPMRFFLCAYTAPGVSDVALILELIIDDRFSVLVSPIYHLSNVRLLNTHVGYARLRMVIHICRIAVVDGAQMVVGILFQQDIEETIPSFHGFGLQHEIILIRERPPHMAICRKACDQVSKITKIAHFIHK